MNVAEIRGLTVAQPWASAIAMAAHRPDGKLIENRTWGTKYRGFLAIHAGKSRVSRLNLEDPRIVGLGLGAGGPNFPHGVFVAIADLVDVHEDQGCCRPWGESSFVDRTTGALQKRVFHWVLEDVTRVRSNIAFKGSLGLLSFPPELQERLLSLRSPGLRAAIGAP